MLQGYQYNSFEVDTLNIQRSFVLCILYTWCIWYIQDTRAEQVSVLTIMCIRPTSRCWTFFLACNQRKALHKSNFIFCNSICLQFSTCTKNNADKLHLKNLCTNIHGITMEERSIYIITYNTNSSHLATYFKQTSLQQTIK